MNGLIRPQDFQRLGKRQRDILAARRRREVDAARGSRVDWHQEQANVAALRHRLEERLAAHTIEIAKAELAAITEHCASEHLTALTAALGMECAAPGCGKPQRALGMCWMHYRRLKRHGDLFQTNRKAAA